jgi:hypothetical protein
MMDGKAEMRMIHDLIGGVWGSSLANGSEMSVCILYTARTGYIVSALNT